MSESQSKKARHIPPHIHCHECQAPIAPENAETGFKTVPVHRGNDPAGRPRIEFVVGVPTPLCPACFARVQAAEQEQTKSRLVIASPNVQRPA